MKARERAEALSREHLGRLSDRRSRRVFQFLEAKGLFFAFPRPKWQGKLSFGEFEWVAEYVEPRVFEVLPAVALRFPGHLKGRPSEELKSVLAELLAGKEVNFHGVPNRKLIFWLNANLPDRRTKPASEKRVLKAFRLLPDNVRKLEELAKSKDLSETDVLDALIACA